MDKEPDLRAPRLRRRQFLANLLFAGGALTLGSLQSAQAMEEPKDGWTLPDLADKPEDKTPTPTPPRPPQPPTAGVPLPKPPGEKPPQIMGMRAIPQDPPPRTRKK